MTHLIHLQLYLMFYMLTSMKQVVAVITYIGPSLASLFFFQEDNKKTTTNGKKKRIFLALPRLYTVDSFHKR